MPKKPKIDKRLNKLFEDIQPETNATGSKSSPKVGKEAPPPAPNPVQKKSESAATPRATRKLHTAGLALPKAASGPNNTDDPSVYSVNIPTGDQDWMTLRLLDETQGRTWTSDEQLLIRQVTDQLSPGLNQNHQCQC